MLYPGRGGAAVIDIDKLEQYRENNRIEAKRALGGLPKSIWETYSAFANTLGGVLLLGVEEQPDKSFRTVDLPDPERLVREFWELLNDPHKASVNLLTSSDVRIETVNGNRIIVIRVPRAERFDKPVYVDGDVNTGSYWRSGEGDHRCTPEQIEAMRRDAAVRTQDMRLLRTLTLEDLHTPSLWDYRRRADRRSPGRGGRKLGDDEYLLGIGAGGTDADGRSFPTGAGLLMFGRYEDIIKTYPGFSLSLREGEAAPELCRENIYDFYGRAADRLAGLFPGDGDFAAAMGEALANCLINADYYSHAGVEIAVERDRVVMTNPGFFRIRVSDAVIGGRSDPRNGELMRMFNLLGAGDGTGGGIPGIFSAWRLRGWSEPVITQLIGPGRVRLTLPLGSAPAPGKKLPGGEGAIRRAARKEMLLDYITEHISADINELSALIGLRPSGTVRLLRELAAEGLISVRGKGTERRYSLRA